jgi:hypothetical protein
MKGSPSEHAPKVTTTQYSVATAALIHFDPLKVTALISVQKTSDYHYKQ